MGGLVLHGGETEQTNGFAVVDTCKIRHFSHDSSPCRKGATTCTMGPACLQEHVQVVALMGVALAGWQG